MDPRLIQDANWGNRHDLAFRGPQGIEMIRAYISYPLSRISVHASRDCRYFYRLDTSRSRKTAITIDTIGAELDRFRRGQYQFTSRAGKNDLWLQIDFNDDEFEIAVLKYIDRMLSRRYVPFRRTRFEFHCQ